jgi:NADPH:quinone reductase-like Zn-dependent oxidoreductase
MNAAVVHAFDAPPRYAFFTDPVAAEGEVLVHVTAAGLHPIVRSLAKGTHYGSTGKLPFIPGVDGVGRLEDNSRVYFGMTRSPFGTFAERTVTSRGMYLTLSGGLDDATIAGIANPGMSSWVALTKRAGFVAGEKVLILGAAGTAGKLAVQIAKHLGAGFVYAAARNRDGLESLKQLGADAIIPLDQDRPALVSSFRSAWADEGLNIVLDYLWGEPAEAVLEAISQKGLQRKTSRIRFVQIGETAGHAISLPAATLRSSDLELVGSGFGSASIEAIFQALAQFFQFAEERSLKINTKPVALRDVETLWTSSEPGARLVFMP